VRIYEDCVSNSNVPFASQALWYYSDITQVKAGQTLEAWQNPEAFRINKQSAPSFSTPITMLAICVLENLGYQTTTRCSMVNGNFGG